MTITGASAAVALRSAAAVCSVVAMLLAVTPASAEIPGESIEEIRAALRSHADAALDRPNWDLLGVSERLKQLTGIEKQRQGREFPFLRDEDPTASLSIGSVTGGWLVNAAELPLPADTYAVLPRQHARNLRFGTDEMIDLLTAAADYVAEVHGGAITWLGNIGADGGGDIRWSVSHNSGRDADLAFFATDAAGQPTPLPDLITFGDDLRSEDGAFLFDVERNWTLVKALLLSDAAQIQYLFISNPLRMALLEHAEETQEPDWLIRRAAAIVRQPGGAAPHDDHLHLRIYCSERDVAAGCENFGALHNGIRTFADARRGARARAVEQLRDPDPGARVNAIRRLALLGPAGSMDDIRGRIADASPEVRIEAVRALVTFGGSTDAQLIAARWEPESDGIVRLELLRALGRLGGATAGRTLAQILSGPELPSGGAKSFDLRIAAADAAAAAGRLEPVPALVQLLAGDDTELSARSDEALRHLLNAEATTVDWRASDLAPEDRESAVQAWRGLDAELRGRDAQPRDVMRRGFERSGYNLTGTTSVQDAYTLARAAGDRRRHISANAQRVLMAATGHRCGSLRWSRVDARSYWTRWVTRNEGDIPRIF